MGQRVVIIAGIPVLVPDDSDVGLPPARDPATFDAAPTPGVDIPDTASAQTVEPIVAPDEAALPAAAPDQSATLPGIVDPFAGQSAVPAPAAASAPVDVPVGDVVNAGGAALGGGGGAAVDVAQSVLTPNGIVGDEPPPPAAEPVPETPEEAQARRDAKRAYLEHQFSVLDDEALSGTATPERRLNIVAEQGAIADLLKATAEEDALVAGDSVKVEQERVKAEAAQQIARQEAEAAARARALEVARQKAEHHIAQIEEQANKPVDRSLGLGIGKSILLALSLVASGLGSALKGQGDKNPALDILMRNIDQHVADQWARKKELWGQVDRIAKGMGEMGDQAAVRQKLLDSYKTSVLMKASKEMERIAKDLPVAKRAAALQLAADTRTKAVERRRTDADNLVKWSIERDKMAEAARHNLEAEKVARSNAAQGWGRLRLDRDQFDKANDHWQKDYELRKAKNDADIKAAERAGNGSALAQAKHDRDMLDREIGGLVPEVKMGADGKPLIEDGMPVVGYQPIMEPDPDKPGQMRKWVPNGSTAAIEGFRTTRAQSLKVMQATDRLVQLIKDNGWEPDFLKSDAFLKEHALYAKVILEAKDKYHLGSLQGSGEGGELALMKKFVGTTDPTSLARMGDPTAGLREMRAGIERDLYVDMTGLGYGGPPVKVPEDNDYGERERVQNTPAAGLAAQAEGRLASAPGVDLVTTQTTQDQWNERGPTGFGGKYTGPGARGIPSPEAADAIYKAADLASGRVDGDPAVGKATLRKIIQSEQHDPVWRLAARLAFENDIDLGVTGEHGVGAYFNPKAYATARASGSPEIMRTLYGTDPTYGYAGTEAYRKERGQGAGVDPEKQRGLVEILRRVR